MNVRVELFGNTDVEVVALAFGFRQVDHTDCASKANRVDRIGRSGRLRRPEERLHSCLVEGFLDATGECSANRHASSRSAPPFVCGGDGSFECRESDEPTASPIPFTHQLPPQGQLTVGSDFGRPCIAHVRVVCPHHDLRRAGRT